LKTNSPDLKLIISNLDELAKNWLNTSNIKNIWDWIYRKRVWRWRIVLTINENTINVWIIDIEKDTKKDYKKWKIYIKSFM
jgi:mRNA-degrading endonuclease RelE of RelBE toxin-antitoxin system